MKVLLTVSIGVFLAANLAVSSMPLARWREDARQVNRQDTDRGDESAFRQEPAAEAARQDPDRELFVDWGKPAFVCLISGRQDGYIEPCGCTGLANQKGGMLRREVLVRELTEDRNWPVVAIDTGNQLRRACPQSTLKLQTTWRGLLKAMHYAAVSLGAADLKTPSGDMIFIIENLKEELQTDRLDKFVLANVSLYDYFVPYQVITVGNHKIGLTAVLGDEELRAVANNIDSDYELSPVDTALERVVPELRKEGCETTFLITNTSLDESRKLAEKHPEFDFVLASCGVGEPTREPQKIQVGDRTVSLVQVGSKGMHVCAIGFFEENGKLISRYQRIPMDARFEVDARMPEMKEIFRQYQNELARMSWDDLQIAPKAHLSDREFVGSSNCEDCHKYEYRVWKEGHLRPDNPKRIGPHFRATIDLQENPNGERTWVTRIHDPECLSCHVTGWNPQEYYPYLTGYTSTADKDLYGNGCENCHGPGSKHVAAEEDDIDDAELRKKYIDEMVVTLEQAKKNLCVDCHDLDNSPDFGPTTFDEYWEKIDHSKSRRKPLD